MAEKGSKYLNTEEFYCTHPDIAEAYRTYDGTGDSFQAVFAQRRADKAAGLVTHNDEMDEVFALQALLKAAEAPGLGLPTYPTVKKRGQK